MKTNDKKLTKGRLYEIVGFGNSQRAWARRCGKENSIVGCIVRSAGNDTFIPVAPNRVGRKIYLDNLYLGPDADLRPLSIKDQKRIERENSNVSR